MRPLELALTLCVLASAATAQEARTGTFRDAGGHGASGGVSLQAVEGGYRIEFDDDFRIDRAPDPYVAFGSAEAFAPGTDFVVLEQRRGEQSYAVPTTIDPAEFDAIWIWCREFGVPLGVAELR